MNNKTEDKEIKKSPSITDYIEDLKDYVPKDKLNYNNKLDCLYKALLLGYTGHPVVLAIFREAMFGDEITRVRRSEKDPAKPPKITKTPKNMMRKLASILSEFCGKLELDINLFIAGAISYDYGLTIQFYGAYVPAICYSLYKKTITPPVVRYSLAREAWDYLTDPSEKGYMKELISEKEAIIRQGAYKIHLNSVIKENIPIQARTMIENGELTSPIELPKFKKIIPYVGCHMDTSYEGYPIEENYFYDVQIKNDYKQKIADPHLLVFNSCPYAYKNYPSSFLYTKCLNRIWSRLTRDKPYQVASDNLDMVTKQEIRESQNPEEEERICKMSYKEYEKEKDSLPPMSEEQEAKLKKANEKI